MGEGQKQKRKNASNYITGGRSEVQRGSADVAAVPTHGNRKWLITTRR